MATTKTLKKAKIPCQKKIVTKKTTSQSPATKKQKAKALAIASEENIFEITEYVSLEKPLAPESPEEIGFLELEANKAKPKKKHKTGQMLAIIEEGERDIDNPSFLIERSIEELDEEFLSEQDEIIGGEDREWELREQKYSADKLSKRGDYEKDSNIPSYESNLKDIASLDVYISLKDIYVEGINTYNRAQGIKHFFLGKGKLLLTKIPILNNVSLTCRPGEKIAFIGENGSGKSSLLKVIAGIYPVKSGIFDVRGRIAASIEMGFGMEYEMTGRQNIKLMMVYNNMLDLYTKELEEQIIEFSELGEKIDWPVKTYSSGMLSRLTFSVNLYQKPDILLLDEVFAAGDSHFVHKSLNVMKDKFLSTPISILVSHQEALIKEVCNKVYYLKNGEIIAEGRPEEVYRQYNRENN